MEESQKMNDVNNSRVNGSPGMDNQNLNYS